MASKTIKCLGGYEIDPETCPIEELERVCSLCKREEDYWNTMQLSAKTFINSVYGVFGTTFFNLSNIDLAESITLQGQDLIKYSVRMVDGYFKEIWHTDYEGHKRVSDIMINEYNVKDFDRERFEREARNPLTFNTLQAYGDTDSAYLTMEPLLNAYGIPDNQMIYFCLSVYKAVMEKYLDDKFDEYAESFHCKANLEKFELEKISRAVIMLAKKNYMCDVAWIDSGVFFDQGHHVTYTGFDVVKGATTNFCRDEMKNFTNFCFSKISNGSVPTQGECVAMLRDMKKRFAMQSPNEIGKTVSISEYEKFVKSDNKKDIEYFDYSSDGRKTAVPIHVRAAAVYNNTILYKNRKYLSKYELLKSGDKIRFYYTSPDDVFGFIPDNFPYEIAPPVDIDVQFEKSLLSPINRIIVALGLKEVPPSLTYSTSLF